jgi:hypothetical protein
MAITRESRSMLTKGLRTLFERKPSYLRPPKGTSKAASSAHIPPQNSGSDIMAHFAEKVQNEPISDASIATTFSTLLEYCGKKPAENFSNSVMQARGNPEEIRAARANALTQIHYAEKKANHAYNNAPQCSMDDMEKMFTMGVKAISTLINGAAVVSNIFQRSFDSMSQSTLGIMDKANVGMAAALSGVGNMVSNGLNSLSACFSGAMSYMGVAGAAVAPWLLGYNMGWGQQPCADPSGGGAVGGM